MNDSGTIIENLISAPSFLLAAIGLIALFVFIFMLIVARKARRGNRDDGTFPMTIEDVNALRSQGLLTPEESARVRQAVARQVTRQMSRQNAPSTASLLADPEVQRLEELARQKAQLREVAGIQTGPAGIDLPTAAPSSAGTPDEVQLPEDVLNMVQLGLITPEELERIKERARDKRREAGF